LKEGKIKLPPQIELPEDLLLVRAEPDSFTIEIR
jgi:hypothetical protein